MSNLQRSLIVCSLMFSSIVYAQQDGVPEDRQSLEQIAEARQAIFNDFGEGLAPKFDMVSEAIVLQNYNHLDPKKIVPSALLKKAVTYFDSYKSKFPNKNYITVVDFSRKSDRVRFFLINMKSGAVETFHTTHGIHSDADDDGFAEVFGNGMGSGMSSLGYVRTAEVYSGKYKRSLRIDGLSSSNSNIRARAVVVHGWDKVHEANVIQGLSWGCITIDWSLKDEVIDKIKEGSLMYVGH
jgi:hypothetical protein